MENKILISAVINTRNEADTLEACLKSLQGFADEIVIVDMESTDTTVSIGQRFGATIYPIKWMKVVEMARNLGLSKAQGKWIILLDPDEVLTKTLKEELRSITQRDEIDFVRIPRKNIIFNKWIRHCNSWPDYLIRFFKKGHVKWSRKVHSQPQTIGNGISLLDSEKLAIKHYNYKTINSFIHKALRYASVRADELIHSDYKLKTSDLMLRPIQEFNTRFFATEGYKDGLHGLVFSLLQAVSILLIYLKVWEKNGFKDKFLSKESFVSTSQETTYEYSFWFSKYFYTEYSHNPFKNTIIWFRHLLNRLSKNL